MNAEQNKQNPVKRYKKRANLTLNPRLKREALRYIAESEDPGRPLSNIVEAELAHDMGNSVTVLREHYINRLVSRYEAAKCWRILDAVATRLA